MPKGSKASVNTVPIPYESRLLKVLRQREEKREMIALAERIAKETGKSTGEVLKVAKMLPGEPADLRGIPVVARGVGGAISHTRPEDAIEKLSRAGR
ncbi:MAG: hypothetical protein ABSC51_05815 [Gaiellaceae bacterium]